MRRAMQLWLAVTAALLCCAVSRTYAASNSPRALAIVDAPSTITLTATQDSYVEEGTPTTNYGDSDSIVVKNAGAEIKTNRYGFLMYDLSKLSGARIYGATLRLWGYTVNTVPDTVAVYAAGTNWTQTGLDWDNMPAIDTAGGAPTSTIGNVHQWYEWNVGSLMPSTTITGANSVLSLALAMTDIPSSDEGDAFHSNLQLTNIPELIVDYNAPPTVATHASASPDPVTGTSASLSVLGADDGGEANLTYAWSSTGPAPVAFSDGGTNTAKNCTATFSQAGNYILTVTITDAGGLSVTSSVNVTVDGALTAPSGLAAIGGNGQVSLAWTAGSGATSYSVYRGTSAGGEGTTPYARDVTATTYTDTHVVNGTTYYYTVAAVNAAATSAPSNEASVAVGGLPFGGVPPLLPAVVQAENYDLGGQGVGYSVTSINGSANSYRPDGVDLEDCSDTGGGYDVGWTSAGQWFDYTVNIISPGTYTVAFRVSSAGSGGTLHLQNAAGVSLTGPVAVPGTGGWQTWTTVTANVTLPAGVQTLQLFQDTGGYNINDMSFTFDGAPGPSGLAATGENGQVLLQWNAASGATSYNVYRGTSPGAESPMRCATGVAGSTYTDRTVANGVAYYYVVTAVDASGTSAPSNEASAMSTAQAPYGGTPWPIPGTIQAENYDVGGQGVGYSVTSVNGSANGYRADGVDLEPCTDLFGGYDLGWSAAGQWFNYTVNVTAAGSYVVQARVASDGPGGTFHFNVDGVSATAEIGVPDTGGWQFWDTLATPITLTAGQHVLTLCQDAIGASGDVANVNWFSIGPLPSPNFGSNVFVYNPSMSTSSMQAAIDNIFAGQQYSQFGSDRCALLFQPGTYNLDVPVGYYMQVLGLGALPDDTTIDGYVQQSAASSGDNATLNFWSGVENLAVDPVDSGGTDMWAVSQANPMRRVHVLGNLALADDGGWASGGFLADSLIDGQVNSESQQQWMSRNDQWASWASSVWNMVFTGVVNPPSGTFPNPAYTVIDATPVVREKPFLTVDSSGNYSVFVPALGTNTQGTTWGGGSPAGQSLPISRFYIAQPGVDNSATINAALSQGLNLIFTPGVYILTGTIEITRPNTIVLGLGLATLLARNGVTPMTVADVDGVVIAGLLFDAGPTSSPVLLQVGPPGSSADHSANPVSLSDLFFRIGGAALGQAALGLEINSNNVIGDDFWIWRADHGSGVGWTQNVAPNGLIVNGNDVTIYGLAVEHFQQYQTQWNGNGGRLYFYQSEAPYDVPGDGAWMDGALDGYASYKVANTVTTHQAYGLGIYCNFDVNPSVVLSDAIEAPDTPGVTFDDMVTISLGGEGQISSIINGVGATVNSSSGEATLNSYP